MELSFKDYVVWLKRLSLLGVFAGYIIGRLPPPPFTCNNPQIINGQPFCVSSGPPIPPITVVVGITLLLLSAFGLAAFFLIRQIAPGETGGAMSRICLVLAVGIALPPMIFTYEEQATLAWFGTPLTPLTVGIGVPIIAFSVFRLVRPYKIRGRAKADENQLFA